MKFVCDSQVIFYVSKKFVFVLATNFAPALRTRLCVYIFIFAHRYIHI